MNDGISHIVEICECNGLTLLEFNKIGDFVLILDTNCKQYLARYNTAEKCIIFWCNDANVKYYAKGVL